MGSSGYSLIARKDRLDTKNGRGGGLLLYVKEGTQYSEIEDTTNFPQLGGINIDGLEVFGFYRSPNSTIESN